MAPWPGRVRPPASRPARGQAAPVASPLIYWTRALTYRFPRTASQSAQRTARLAEPSGTFLHGRAAPRQGAGDTERRPCLVARATWRPGGTSRAPGPDACVMDQWPQLLSSVPSSLPSPRDSAPPKHRALSSAPASSASRCISSAGQEEEEGGGEEAVCGALLTRPAWPAASSARRQEPRVPLGRRSGASGPLFCACGLQVRSLRPPGVLWLLLFRTPHPPGLEDRAAALPLSWVCLGAFGQSPHCLAAQRVRAPAFLPG